MLLGRTKQRPGRLRFDILAMGAGSLKGGEFSSPPDYFYYSVIMLKQPSVSLSPTTHGIINQTVAMCAFVVHGQRIFFTGRRLKGKEVYMRILLGTAQCKWEYEWIPDDLVIDLHSTVISKYLFQSCGLMPASRNEIFGWAENQSILKNTQEHNT